MWLAAQHHGGSVNWMIAAALGAMLGHIFPVWLSGRGGRGVSTGVGAFLLICWPAVTAAYDCDLARCDFPFALCFARVNYGGSIFAASDVFSLRARARAITHVGYGCGTTIASLMIILPSREYCAADERHRESSYV